MTKDSTEELLNNMLSIIKQYPGIRPSELNRRLGINHSNYYRQILIKRGLVIKKKSGAAINYFLSI
jgi:hypothetical protein